MKLGLLLGGIVWAGLYFLLRRRHHPAAEYVAAAGLLAMGTVGFFWQILLTPNRWMPAGGGDLAPFLYPNYRFAAEQLQQGTLPLWNPHLYSGMPFAADIQTGLFYPLNLLIFLLITPLTYEWLEYLAVFHFWLAGFSMYLCLRLMPLTQRLHPMAAFAGAIAFEFSDLFIVHFGNLNMIAVAAWLPLVFLLFQHSLSENRWGLAAASGAVLAIATLAGHIQITLFILLTLGLFTLFDIACRRHMIRPLSSLLISLLVLLGLSALLLLPAYEMSRYTPRATLPYIEAARYSLHPGQLIGLLIPNYFGRDPALHWGPWERVETGYIGLLTLYLSVIGLLGSHYRLKWFGAGLATISLLLALGGYSLLHGWLYAIMPGFNQLRAPARFILLLDFALAMLAAFGLQFLLQPLTSADQTMLKNRLLKPLSWGLGGLLVISGPLAYYALLVTQDRDPSIFQRAQGAAHGVMLFALFSLSGLLLLHYRVRKIGWPRAHRIGFGMAAISLIALDLFTMGHNVDVGQRDPVAQFEHPAAIAFLKEDPHFFRIEVTTDVWHLWQPNTALLHNLFDVWGLYNPLTLADTTLYWSGAPPRDSGRYRFLGIKYIIASKAGAPADGDIVPVFADDPDINIYLNREAVNRLLFVGQASVVESHAAAWEAIRAADFEPTAQVILEGGQPLNTTPQSALSLVQYGTDRVTIAVTTDEAGYLVLADAYYPGWQATVDGQPTPIQRANYAFRAVYVPPGEHVVTFIFDPLLWKLGVSVSGLTGLLLLGWLIKSYRERIREHSRS